MIFFIDNAIISWILKIFGGVAQLVERLNGIQEARGSTPLISTKKIATDIFVCCYFRLLNIYPNAISIYNKNTLFLHNIFMKRFALLFVIVLLISFCFLIPMGDYQLNALVPRQPEPWTNELVPYSNKIYHIFFHSLILNPHLAFKSSRAQGYDDWMITREEFKEILNRLYQNDFALVDIDYVKQMKKEQKPLLFFENKKPLILSVDDVNYYEYMKNDGFAEKLIVDEGGKLATTVLGSKGRTIDYEGDIMPIINDFVDKNPDFSFNGAKGIVGVTGYQGVFGYRINWLEGLEKTQAIINAKNVANNLKMNGWKIACHSYSHTNAFKDGSIAYDRFKRDVGKWNDIVAPVTGRTNIYISPFGIEFYPNDLRLRHLAKSGFDIFCPVYKKMNIKFAGDFMISQRLNIDGFTLQKYPNRIESELFCVDNILDKTRPGSNHILD